ncbi:MAG: hypothetical protein RI897_4176 [Verrucomicrobiota bacterium]
MDGAAGICAFEGCEAECEALEVIVGGVGGFAVFFDTAEEFAHGALEAVFEPGTLQVWGTISLVIGEADCLLAEAGAGGLKGAFGSDEQG